MSSRPPGALLIRSLSVIVPWPRRAEWIAEWEGELAWMAGPPPHSPRTRMRTWLRAIVAILDAVWLQHRHGRQGMFNHDLRIAVRSLARRPGYALTIILTLGVGIGGATAIFSVVDAVILRPLPYHEPDRLAFLWRPLPSGTAVPDLDAERLEMWRGQREIFSAIGTFADDEMLLTGSGDPRNAFVVGMTPSVFTILGATPVVGRPFTAADAEADARVVVVSEDYWRSALGAPSSLSGQSVTLDDQAYQVIGVMSRQFRFPLGGRSFWLPLNERNGSRLAGLARLQPGVSDAAARQRIETITTAIEAEQPRPDGWGIFLRPLDDRVLGQEDNRALWFLAGAVLSVLLIGCANAANLMLVQGSNRARELAIRGALGASRGRLVAMLLTESILLVTVAGALGVVMATLGVRVLRSIAPSSYAVFAPNDFIVDLRVLAFTMSLAIVTGLLFGVGPSIVSSRHRARLAGGDRAGTGTRGMRRMRAALVVGELALAMALLISASLLVRSFANQVGTDLGIQRDGVVVLDLDLPSHRYPDVPARMDVLNHLTDRMRMIPGVQSVSLAEDVPPTGGFRFGVHPQAEGAAPSEGPPQLMPINRVDENYFEVLNIPLLAGRSFEQHDTPESDPVAVVDVDMAAFLWPGVAPAAVVGRRFRLDDDEEWLTAVGVVGDLVLLGLDERFEGVCGSEECRFEMYRPIRQAPRRWSNSIIVRVAPGATNLVADVRAGVWDVDPSLPIEGIETIDERILEDLAQPRFVLRLVTSFTILAVALAVLGVYAVLAYSVAQRTREFGIRIAMGARPQNIMGDVIRRGALLASLGILVGAGGALAGSRVLNALLHGVAATDPVSLVGAGVTLASATILASVLPARRAIRVNPTDALRAAD